MQSDLAFAFEKLANKHPGLYRYVEQKKLLAAFDNLIAQAPQLVDYWEAYSYVSQIAGSIQCGHTRFTPEGQAWSKLKEAAVFFPLPVRWLNDSLYVDIDSSGNEKQWWRVERVNGEEFGGLLRFLEERFALDGDSRKGKQLFFDNLAYYYAVWKERPPAFLIQLKSLDEKRDTVLTLGAADWKGVEEMRSKKGIVFGTGKLQPLAYSQTGTTGFLTIRNFNSNRHKAFGLNFPGFLDSVFHLVKRNNTDHLIIDLRNNGGGDDAYGALLFSYLTNQPFRYFKEVVSLKNKKFIPVDHPQLQSQPPSSVAYQGKVTLLVDGFTFSTAADFAAIFAEHKRGQIIGMETGGALQGNNSGNSEEVVLPNSRIVLSIPLWRYTNAVTQDGSRSGVVPNLQLIPNRSWLIEKKDHALETALGQ